MSVACSSNRASRPLPEAIARAVAARSDLFGYFPSVGDWGRGGFQLVLSDSDDDHATLDRVASSYDHDAPLPRRGDGTLMIVGDHARTPEGRGRVSSIEQPTATSEGRVHVLVDGADRPSCWPIASVGGRWA